LQYSQIGFTLLRTFTCHLVGISRTPLMRRLDSAVFFLHVMHRVSVRKAIPRTCGRVADGSAVRVKPLRIVGLGEQCKAGQPILYPQSGSQRSSSRNSCLSLIAGSCPARSARRSVHSLTPLRPTPTLAGPPMRRTNKERLERSNGQRCALRPHASIS